MLAAGQSARMGQLKPLLPLRGKALLAHVLDALREADLEEIIVVLGADADRIRGTAMFVVEVLGQKGGHAVRTRMWTSLSYEDAYRLHRTNATAYLVGTGGAVATELLLEGAVRAKGLVIPERLPVDAYLEKLRSKGVAFREQRLAP